jgi:allantoin racemase
MKIRVISPLIEVPGPRDIRRVELRLAAVAGIPAEFSHAYPSNGPIAIESEYEDALAVPGTVRAVIQAEKEGMDAVVINCTADTGLNASREAVNIPVVAPTLASMHLAAQLTHRFSVLSFSERINSRFEKMAWKWGLAHKLVSVRSVEIPFGDLYNEEEILAQRLFEAGLRCVEEDGAHGLILGCTDFEDVTPQIQSKFDQKNIPVLLFQPYVIAAYEAYALVSMGLRQSKLTYPNPKEL